jgi:hypothetical protein
MVRWQHFESAEPGMAAAAHHRLTQFGPGLAFLATVRADGGPRLHPICVCIAEGGLYAWLLRASPKRRDLARDPRYALHAFPPEATDDECYITGIVRHVDDPALEAVGDEEDFIEFDIERVMLADYEHRGQWPPAYRKWRA